MTAVPGWGRSQVAAATSTPGDDRGGRIPTLDGWRGVAIIAVILSHSRHLIQPGGVLDAPRLNGVIAHFRLGVDLFFAISGYLITSLLARELSVSGKISLPAFYTRRVFRILPLIFAYLITLATIRAFIPDVARRWEFVSTLLFGRNYLMQWTDGAATNHFWSLSIEEHFYLFWPPVLALLGARRGLRAAVIVALVVASWRALDARAGVFLKVFGSDPGILFRTDTRCDALLWGAVAGLAMPRFREMFARWARLPLTGVVLASLVAWFWIPLPLLASAAALLFPLLILSTTTRPRSGTARFLETAPIRWVGRRSYSLYVWQTLFLQVPQVSFSLRASTTGSMMLAAYLLDVVLIVLVAEVAHRLVEIPVQRFGRNLAKRFVPAV